MNLEYDEDKDVQFSFLNVKTQKFLRVFSDRFCRSGYLAGIQHLSGPPIKVFIDGQIEMMLDTGEATVVSVCETLDVLPFDDGLGLSCEFSLKVVRHDEVEPY